MTIRRSKSPSAAPLADKKHKALTAKSRARRGLTFNEVIALAMRLPGMEETTSYGTPALKVRGKFLARIWEDGTTMVLRTTFDEREHLLAKWPKEFFFTDHYANYPTVLVHLTKVNARRLEQLLEDAWRRAASANAVREFDATRKAR